MTEKPPAAEAGQSRLYRPKREAQSSISKHEHSIKQRGLQSRLKTRSQGGSTSGDERGEPTLDASFSNPKSKKCAAASAAGDAEHEPQSKCSSSKKTHSKNNKPTKSKKQNRRNSVEERQRVKRALEQFERWRQNYALQQNYLRRILEAISFETCMREQQERLSAASGSASVLPPPASDSITTNSVAIPIVPPSTYIGPPLPPQLFEQSDPSRAGPGPSTLSNMQRELLVSLRTQASAPPISDRSALSTSVASSSSSAMPLPALSAANSAYPAQPYPLLHPFVLPPFPLPHGDWRSYPLMSANQAPSSHASSSRGARPFSMPPFDMSQSLGRQVGNRGRSAARPSSVPPEGVDTICEVDDDDEDDESELDESELDPAFDEDEFDLVAASLGNSAGSQAFDVFMRAPRPHRSFAGLSAPHAMDDEGAEAIPAVGAEIFPLSSSHSSPSVAEREPPPSSVAVRVIAEPPPSSFSALLESPSPERTPTGALHQNCDEPPAELRLAMPALRDEVAGARQWATALAPATPFDPLLPSAIYIDQALTTPTHQPSAPSFGSTPI